MSYLYIENQIFMKKLLLLGFFSFFASIYSFSQGVTNVAKDSLGVPVDTTGIITVKNSYFLSKIIAASNSSLVLRGPAQSFIQFNHLLFKNLFNSIFTNFHFL